MGKCVFNMHIFVPGLGVLVLWHLKFQIPMTPEFVGDLVKLHRSLFGLKYLMSQPLAVTHA